jgi:hypothetical protein
MKFAQIAASNDLTKKALPEILKNSVLLADYIEFFMKPGSAVSFRKAGVSDKMSAQTRVLNQAYPETTFAPDYGTATRKFLGDQVKIDVALQNMGYDLGSEFESNLLRHMRDFPGLFHNMLVNGDPDTDATQFAGLKLLVTSSRVVKAAENGLELKRGNDNTAKTAQQVFLEKLDETIAMCEGNNKVLLMNASVRARLNAVAREYLQWTKNDFGSSIALYNGVALIDPGEFTTAVNTYSPIIGFDESCGTAVDKCAAVYCVSFEQEDGMSFATCKDGFKVYDQVKVDNFLKSTYELIADSALIRSNAISKLEGLYL